MPANVSQWVTLKDFRPGIKARGRPSDTHAGRGEILGAADKDGTHRCHALPDGSLGPMPGLVDTINPNRPAAHEDVFHNAFVISGFWCVGGIDFGSNEFHVAWQWREDAPPDLTYHWIWVRMWDTGAGDVLMNRVGDLHPLAAFVDSIAANATWFSGHRSHPYDEESSGIPQIAAAWFANDPAKSVWAFWPDAGTPGGWPPQIIGSPYWPSLAVSHQGRHVIFDHRPDPHGPDHSWNHNEDIYYTNPNLQSVDNPGRPDQYGLENVTGYIGAVSTSANELLLIKSGHGALHIRGDIGNNPTVLTIPGAPYAGDSHHQPTVTPIGAVFITQAGGAYLWNGGENCECISADAIDPKEFNIPYHTRDNELTACIGRLWYWYDWVIFPNNWAWNWKNNSWWRFEDPEVVQFYWCGPDFDVREAHFHVAPAQVKSASSPAIYTYDYNTPAASYVWTSLPNPVLENKRFKIREVVFVLTGQCTWKFEFWNEDGTIESHDFTTTRSNRPTYLRRNANVSAQEIKLRITCTKGATSGVVHEVRMGIQPDVHYPQNMA